MSNQYFENNPLLASEIKELTYYYKGQKIALFTDLGVFSKGGIDFGTNLLLKNLELKDTTKTLLDVGCGYGVMGISVAKTNPSINVLMCDVNDRALGLTKIGIEKNNLNNASFIHSDRYEKIEDSFDIIISNPPIRAGKIIVHGIILGAIDHLNDGGQMWCVIQKKQGAESAITALKQVYSCVEIVIKDKGYYIIKAIK